MCDEASSRWRNEASSPVSRSPAIAALQTIPPSLKREEKLVRGQDRRRLLVEPGHAHADEAHRARRLEAAQEVDGHRPDLAQLVGGGGQGASPGDGGEVVVADLDADRAAALLLALERGAELLGQPAQLGLQL